MVDRWDMNFCVGNNMSECKAKNIEEQKACGGWDKATEFDRCTHQIDVGQDETPWCDCLEAQKRQLGQEVKKKK